MKSCDFLKTFLVYIQVALQHSFLLIIIKVLYNYILFILYNIIYMHIYIFTRHCIINVMNVL